MFEWLLEEMGKVKTRKFHLVEGPMPDETRRAMEAANVPIPPSYKAFILRFGNAELYRQGGVYLVRVFAAPRQLELENGERLLHFGRTDLALAYFKESLLAANRESPVFEWRYHQGIRLAATGFEDWLQKRCKTAKRRFKAKQWKEIQDGPRPFDAREIAILEARRKFRWRRVGVAENGDLLFEVHNGSESVLPYLSIGVRGSSSDFEGGVSLRVCSILPGETSVVQTDCYKDQLSPAQVIAFEKPEPGPEDRELYWEFKQTGNQ